MSSDNIIYIKKIMDLWWVWEQSASVNVYGLKDVKEAYLSRSFNDELSAYKFGFKISNLTEYGVNKI